MNACLLAACAVNARARRKGEEQTTSFAEELCYKVMLRKYYYFKPMVWSSPIEYNESSNSFSMRGANIEARTYVTATSFSVRASKCPNGIDAYIRDNLEMIIGTDEWKAREDKVLVDYVSDIKKLYSVVIDPEQLNYTTEYYWEVK